MKSPSLPEIVAHRGASHDAPENTLAAFALGWRQGADAAECDVRLTRDGRLVLMHDASVARTTGGGARAVRNLSFDAIRSLDAGAWKGDAWRGEHVPTLEEALATVPEGKRMLVEVKCGKESAAALAGVFDEAGVAPEAAALITFDLKLCEALRGHFPERRVHWIVYPEKPAECGLARIDLAKVPRMAADRGFDGVNLIGTAFVARPSLSAELHEAGLEAHAWTIDKPEDARRIAALGVDSITTNRPERIREALSV